MHMENSGTIKKQSSCLLIVNNFITLHPKSDSYYDTIEKYKSPIACPNAIGNILHCGFSRHTRQYTATNTNQRPPPNVQALDILVLDVWLCER